AARGAAGRRLATETVAGGRAVIEAELTEYLGPMARIVVEEHVTAAHDLTDFIDSLAGELNDPAKSATFKARVRDRLASAVSGKSARQAGGRPSPTSGSRGSCERPPRGRLPPCENPCSVNAASFCSGRADSPCSWEPAQRRTRLSKTWPIRDGRSATHRTFSSSGSTLMVGSRSGT